MSRAPCSDVQPESVLAAEEYWLCLCLGPNADLDGYNLGN